FHNALLLIRVVCLFACVSVPTVAKNKRYRQPRVSPRVSPLMSFSNEIVETSQITGYSPSPQKAKDTRTQSQPPQFDEPAFCQARKAETWNSKARFCDDVLRLP